MTPGPRRRLTPAQRMGWERAEQGQGLGSDPDPTPASPVALTKVSACLKWDCGVWGQLPEPEPGPHSGVTVSRGLSREVSGPGRSCAAVT